MDPKATIPHVLATPVTASGALPAATAYVPMRGADANGLPLTRLVNGSGNPFASINLNDGWLRSVVGDAPALIAHAVLTIRSADNLQFDQLRGYAPFVAQSTGGIFSPLGVTSFGMGYNGLNTFYSLNAAGILTQSDFDGDLADSKALQVAEIGNWSINHTPVANTQATIGRAAAANKRHICTSIHAKLIGVAAAAEATVLVNLRDGATGAGTILWSTRLLVGPSQKDSIEISGLSIVGSNNTAMTLEFAAAGGANTFESVALTGYSVAG